MPSAPQAIPGKPASDGWAVPVARLSVESDDIADSSGVGLVESAHALNEKTSAIAVTAVNSFFNFFTSLLDGRWLQPLHS